MSFTEEQTMNTRSIIRDIFYLADELVDQLDAHSDRCRRVEEGDAYDYAEFDESDKFLEEMRLQDEVRKFVAEVQLKINELSDMGK